MSDSIFDADGNFDKIYLTRCRLNEMVNDSYHYCLSIQGEKRSALFNEAFQKLFEAQSLLAKAAAAKD